MPLFDTARYDARMRSDVYFTPGESCEDHISPSRARLSPAKWSVQKYLSFSFSFVYPFFSPTIVARDPFCVAIGHSDAPSRAILFALRFFFFFAIEHKHSFSLREHVRRCVRWRARIDCGTRHDGSHCQSRVALDASRNVAIEHPRG